MQISNFCYEYLNLEIQVSRIILYMHGMGEVNDKMSNSQINSVYCQITIKVQRNSVKYGSSLTNL